MLDDVRFAVRLLRKSPLLTLTAALSLAIGIGANTPIFSVASALLLHPYPAWASPIGSSTSAGRRAAKGSIPCRIRITARCASRRRSWTSAHTASPCRRACADVMRRIGCTGSVVSANYFTVLGTRPVYGRMLEDRDDQTVGGHPVTVISHELWERRFESDPNIVGKSILLNSQPFTVVGIAPRGFQGTTVLRPDVWVPTSMTGVAMPGKPSGRLPPTGGVADDEWPLEGCRHHPAGTSRDGCDRRRTSTRLPAGVPAIAASSSRSRR